MPDSDFLISVGGQSKLEEELFGDVKEPAATVADNGRESAKKRARIETPSGEEKQRRAQKRARPAETQSAAWTIELAFPSTPLWTRPQRLNSNAKSRAA